MWPRQAPLWAQVANWFEYADWQVALGVSNGVSPTWWRTPITLAFAVLGAIGSREHLRLHARSWRALRDAVRVRDGGAHRVSELQGGRLVRRRACFRTSVPHEVRDRDYFFVLGFWVWGAWAGIGAVALARLAGAHWVPVGVARSGRAARAQRARRESSRRAGALGARSPSRTRCSSSAPPNAVLFTGGDNDSFTAWYAQAVEGMRPDVTIVVAPLLNTEWYRAQLARRASLVYARGRRANPASRQHDRGSRA